jgi:hypothetical protein
MNLGFIGKQIVLSCSLFLLAIGTAEAKSNTNPGGGNLVNNAAVATVGAAQKVQNGCLTSWSGEIPSFYGNANPGFTTRAVQTPANGGVLCPGPYNEYVKCVGWTDNGCGGETCGWGFGITGPGTQKVTSGTANTDKANGGYSKSVDPVVMTYTGTTTLVDGTPSNVDGSSSATPADQAAAAAAIAAELAALANGTSTNPNAQPMQINAWVESGGWHYCFVVFKHQ